MSPLTRTQSTATSHSSYSLEKPAEVEQPTQSRKAAYAAACSYPATAPHRAVFLTVRTLVVIFGIVEIALSIVAQQSIDRGDWMAPMLSPAITSAWASGLDVYFVACHNRRSHPLTRMLYDGAIGIGYAIAAGFLVSFTLGDLIRSTAGSTSTTAAVGAAILFCMFSSMVLQFGISVSGTMQWLQLRRERRLASSPA